MGKLLRGDTRGGRHLLRHSSPLLSSPLLSSRSTPRGGRRRTKRRRPEVKSEDALQGNPSEIDGGSVESIGEISG